MGRLSVASVSAGSDAVACCGPGSDVDLGQDAIKALVELIATTLLPDAASKHKMIFGELCSPADFQRHISDLMTALKAS